MDSKMGTQEESASMKEQFNRLAVDARERLVSSIEQTPPQLLVERFSADVAQRSGMDAAWVQSLCSYLADWFSFLSDDPGAFFERIVMYLAEAPHEGSEEGNDASLQNHWRRIMKSDATLGVTLKAANILNRQANSFQKVRTTTEIRPVYFNNAEIPPTHAVLLHQLHITYQTEFGAQTVHIAVDAQSIVSLLDVLNRAITKEKALLEQKAYYYLGRT
jgi:hypothetical protein